MMNIKLSIELSFIARPVMGVFGPATQGLKKIFICTDNEVFCVILKKRGNLSLFAVIVLLLVRFYLKLGQGLE
jgi:hypothetical protein